MLCILICLASCTLGYMTWIYFNFAGKMYFTNILLPLKLPSLHKSIRIKRFKKNAMIWLTLHMPLKCTILLIGICIELAEHVIQPCIRLNSSTKCSLFYVTYLHLPLKAKIVPYAKN